jgi:hypothetical protein
MRARRIRFAAPFVIVTTASCGQPAPVQLPTESVVVASAVTVDAAVPELDAAAVVDAAPIIDAAAVALTADAAPEPPVPSAIPETPPDLQHAVVIVVASYSEQPEGYVSCHNFGPQNRGCNPPRPIYHPELRLPRPIRAVQRKGKQVLVTIGINPGDPYVDDMPVTGHGATTSERSRVGRVERVTGTSAVLRVNLSKRAITEGADLQIETKYKEQLLTSPPLPQTIERRIIGLRASDDGTEITIGAGTNEAVDRGVVVQLIDEHGKPLRNGKTVILEANDRTSIAKVKLTPDEVKHAHVVRLSAY